MTPAVFIASVALAGVFVTAGLAKLADLEGSATALRGFGLPPTLAAPLGLLLPLAEVAVAAALVVPGLTRWGAGAAAVLLLAFVVGIATSLARGREPDCHCFGQLHSAPAGRGALARNALLAGAAGFVLLAGADDAGPRAFDWFGDLSTGAWVGIAGGALTVGVLSLGAWAVFELLRQHGRVLLRVDALEQALEEHGVALPGTAVSRTPEPQGLPVGSPAPPFSLADVRDDKHSLESLLAAGKPVMLLFSDPDCGPCSALLPEIGTWQRDLAQEMTLAVVSRGEPERSLAESAERGIERVLLQVDREVATAYLAHGTPSAVVVAPGGTIASPVALGAEAVRALAQAPREPAPVSVGDAVPAVRLRDLDGRTVELPGSIERPSVVVLWNPGCGHCQAMVPDLVELDAALSDAGADLLLVSAGPPDDVEALGLRGRILIDDSFAAGAALGARGTPSAVLVSREGTVASETTAGGAAVLELARELLDVPAGVAA